MEWTFRNWFCIFDLDFVKWWCRVMIFIYLLFFLEMKQDFLNKWHRNKVRLDFSDGRRRMWISHCSSTLHCQTGGLLSAANHIHEKSSYNSLTDETLKRLHTHITHSHTCVQLYGIPAVTLSVMSWTQGIACSQFSGCIVVTSSWFGVSARACGCAHTSAGVCNTMCVGVYMCGPAFYTLQRPFY